MRRVTERAPYRWVNLTMNAPFAPNGGLGLLSYRSRLWLLGGWNLHDKVHFRR